MESKTARELLEEAYSHLLYGDLSERQSATTGLSGWIKSSEGWFTGTDKSGNVTSVHCAIGAIALANMTEAEKRLEGAYVSFHRQATDNPEVFKAGLAVWQAVQEFYTPWDAEGIAAQRGELWGWYHKGLGAKSLAVQTVGERIYTFNDAAGTSYQDVLGVFERGIKILVEAEEKVA